MTSPILLCATTRLAQTLRAAHPNDAATVWDTPRAFALEAWLDQLGEEGMLSGVLPALVLLDGFSERILWRHVIEDSIDLDEAPLFDVAAMAASAADAHALATIWALAPGKDDLSREAAQFAQWRGVFRQRLDVNGWTVAVERRVAVVEAIEAGRLRVRDRIVFVGFDALDPLQRRLHAALDAGLHAPAAEDTEECPAEIASFEDIDAECQAAARWAGAQLQANQSWRIGMVVPDLNSMRDCLKHELERALHPELSTPGCAERSRRYNFSLGRPLAEVPVVACALQLLRLASDVREVEQPALAGLLHSPYWSDSERESDGRAVLDAHLRRRARRHTSVAALVKLGHKLHSQSRLAFPAALRHLSQLMRHAGECEAAPRLPSAWAQTVRTILRDAGWAGNGGQGCRVLSSHEYQAREAWSELLDRFAGSDQIIGMIPFSQMLAHLQALCLERTFQPQTRGTPSVHVLGVLESTGLQFDALWVMGMHDGAWPPAPAPNPLIPVALQRARGTPNACAAVQLAYARTILRRLQRQAPRVHFSCALMSGSQELRPSPLFVPVGEPPESMPAAPAPSWTDALEYLEDATGPALGEGELASGGVSLLRAQAICPAWAFYRYRLGAAALEQSREGLGPQDRGTLVHDALEWFWKQTGSRTELAELHDSPAAFEERLLAAVGASLEAHEARTEPMPVGSRELEASRLTRLLREWLAAEMQRSDFTVMECEREVKHAIGPVALTLRIDRIDEQDGQLVVIDYKTGTLANASAWAAARITEPQLPIYALALTSSDAQARVGALVFGKVRLGETRFMGLSATDKFVKGVPGMHAMRGKPFAAFPDWNALQAHWRERIAAIADEFARGAAAVRVEGNAKLEYCDVLPLLRLPERESLRAGLSMTATAPVNPSLQEA